MEKFNFYITKMGKHLDVAIGTFIISCFSRKQIRVHGNGDDIHTGRWLMSILRCHVSRVADIDAAECGGDNREMTRLPLDASFIRLSKVKRRVMTLIYSIIISSGD